MKRAEKLDLVELTVQWGLILGGTIALLLAGCEVWPAVNPDDPTALVVLERVKGYNVPAPTPDPPDEEFVEEDAGDLFFDASPSEDVADEDAAIGVSDTNTGTADISGQAGDVGASAEDAGDESPEDDGDCDCHRLHHQLHRGHGHHKCSDHGEK